MLLKWSVRLDWGRSSILLKALFIPKSSDWIFVC